MAAFAAASMLMSAAEAAAVKNRWQEAALGAVAILPPPIRSGGVTGGSLACAEQRWGFRLRIETSASAAIRNEDASVDVDGVSFPVKAGPSPGAVTIAISFEMIELLKAGNRLSFRFGNAAPPTVFSLRGSRTALDAVAPRCSRVDMSAYERVALSKTDEAAQAAAMLMADEATLFRQATGKQPVLAAATVGVAPDAVLLFASLCGSTSYYGQSGCTLSGFVRQGAAADWREVYNSEGMALYVDWKASAGRWPDLVTLPGSGDAEPSHWMWTGLVYEIREPAIAEDGALRGAIQ
jgi:hypothetical protein